MSTPEPNEPVAETEIIEPQSRRRGILIAAVVVVVLIALGVWWRSTYSENTDDAQVNGHLIQVSSRINGQVAKVYVEENQVVKAGDRSPTSTRAIIRSRWRTPRPHWPAPGRMPLQPTSMCPS